MNYSAFDIRGMIGPVELDTARTLGRGATATVYAARLAGQKYAAKIYRDDYLMDFCKIWAMLANPPVRLQFAEAQYPQLAWPSALIGDADKRPVGYLMPLVDMTRAFSLDHYYDQILLKKLASPSESALSYKLEIGRNLSLLLADLHDHGHHFIDMKPQNILVLRGAHVVTLLDCDGFSITSTDGKRFPAALVSTDYISPEAFNAQAKPETLGEAQDRYALAVILFQLINRGTHPFQGIIKVAGITANTNDEKAAQGLYPHGIRADKRIAPRPQSTFFLLDDELLRLFDRAFIGNPDRRPSAREWANCLDKLLTTKALVCCEKVSNDINHIRFVGKECPACYLYNLQIKPTRDIYNKTPLENNNKATEKDTNSNKKETTTCNTQYCYAYSAYSKHSSSASGKKGEKLYGIPVLIFSIVALLILGSINSSYNNKVINEQTKTETSTVTSELATLASNTKDAFTLGMDAYDKKDYLKAAEYWTESAEKGNSAAQFNLGLLYRIGLGVTKDDVKTFELWRKSAVKGEVLAQVRLGSAFSEGRGVTKNDVEAFEWWRIAAANGNVDAQHLLGHAFWDGKGTAKDIQSALYYYRKAAEGGSPGANVSIGWLYMTEENGLEKDYTQAMIWNTKAVELGDGEGASNIGLLYENGWGVAQNFSEAAYWYKRAIELKAHSGQAEVHLGKLYLTGKDIEKNPKEAGRLFRRVLSELPRAMDEYKQESKRMISRTSH